jgi:hypothetical protein
MDTLIKVVFPDKIKKRQVGEGYNAIVTSVLKHNKIGIVKGDGSIVIPPLKQIRGSLGKQ